MPTTTIESTVTGVGVRRRVAKDLSMWWRRQGADINHVLTRFLPVADESVYSGPFPLAGSPVSPFALVSCVLSVERDAEFRRAYVTAVRTALAPEIPPDRVFVSFQPTDPALHFGPDSVEVSE